jgi:hypothetical protein
MKLILVSARTHREELVRLNREKMRFWVEDEQ